MRPEHEDDSSKAVMSTSDEIRELEDENVDLLCDIARAERQIAENRLKIKELKK